jgi:hypothetical protein
VDVALVDVDVDVDVGVAIVDILRRHEKDLPREKEGERRTENRGS